MGNTQAPSSSHRFVMASRAFTPQEVEDLNSLFESLAAQSQSNSKYISPSVFEAYYGICGPLAFRLFEVVTQNRKDGMLTFEDLVIAKAVYEKGTRNEIEDFIYDICDVNGDGILLRCDLEAVLDSIRDTVFHHKCSQSSLSTYQVVMEVFLSTANFSQKVEGMSENSMSLDDFRNWCNLIPSARKYLGSLLMPPDLDRPGFQVPQLLYPENTNPDVLILQKEYAWHIAGGLSQMETEKWNLLYHSAIYGRSFTTFMGIISRVKGPTILVVKDIDGYIHGGYASQPWERHGDFYGDMKSFVFQLYPQAYILRPSGANNNLQWCAMHFSSDSIPNGIGFGGRANHFGLFLSANLDKGHSFACTTFNSPCLSKTNHFVVDVIECWGVISEGSNNGKTGIVEGTVLERFQEDHNMLKMVGLANASE
ncbi:hypothetical protein HPP92_022721 [Vanilla planifolia]|uniref:TLDc domain-containing protein n=1 Tax=Vanilla planifolia TaxID=51239 RepID=A0A835UFP0_VANPL|nr:hypothetical protein HPP92_022721 [Vanilla planifolia]